MPKAKPRSLKPQFPIGLQFFMQGGDIAKREEPYCFFDSIRCETIADIMNNKELDNAYPKGGLGKLIEKLRHLVCMAAFAQKANKELDIKPLRDAIDEILDLCRQTYTEYYMNSKDTISIENFENIYECLHRMESDIEEIDNRFLPSLIHRNLMQSVEMLERETFG